MRAVIAGDDIAVLMAEYRQESGASFSETSDRLMVAVAESFLDGRLDYNDADQVANRWWGLVCNSTRPASDSIPDLAYEIFEAFDQGEYDHGDGLDSVEQYTIPLLRSALDRPPNGGADD